MCSKSGAFKHAICVAFLPAAEPVRLLVPVTAGVFAHGLGVFSFTTGRFIKKTRCINILYLINTIKSKYLYPIGFCDLSPVCCSAVGGGSSR